MGEKYQCANCKRFFVSGWRDEDAKKQAKDIFGKGPDDWKVGYALVCDDCFKEINPLKNPLVLEKVKKEI